MLNHVTLIGRLTADPEVKYTQSGIAYAKFTLAVNRRFKNAQGEKEADFLSVVAWRKTAELVGEYLKKGRLICVEGSIQTRKWETPEGQKRTFYEIAAENVVFIDSKRQGQEAPPLSDADAPPGPPPDNGPQGEPPEPTGDDLPF